MRELLREASFSETIGDAQSLDGAQIPDSLTVFHESNVITDILVRWHLKIDADNEIF